MVNSMSFWNDIGEFFLFRWIFSLFRHKKDQHDASMFPPPYGHEDDGNGSDYDDDYGSHGSSGYRNYRGGYGRNYPDYGAEIANDDDYANQGYDDGYPDYDNQDYDDQQAQEDEEFLDEQDDYDMMDDDF